MDGDDDGWSVTSVAFQSVQLAGISERLPSGSTTSNSRAPRRFMVPISGNERPSNGCRSRSIITELEMSRRWVVCSGFLHRPRSDTGTKAGHDEILALPRQHHPLGTVHA